MDALRALLDRYSVDLAFLVGWIALLLPAVMYLGIAWPKRRELLFGRLSPAAIRLYYEQFFPSYVLPPGDAPLRSRFRKDFHKLYGRRHYILPLALMAIISGAGIWITARSLQGSLCFSASVRTSLPIAISAFLGAYAWVLYDQFARCRSGDFTSHDVYAAVYRFLIAIPLGVSLAAFARPEVGMGMAFLLAAFPTTTLFTFARRLVSKNLGVGEGKEGGQLELEKLQSIGRSNAERYLDEGVSTIAELAWANPIDLMVRTNRELNFVIDSISQALLWVYLEDGVQKLYPLSLRGAQEVSTLLDDLASRNPKAKAGAERSLQTAAGLMGLDRESLLYTLLIVKRDPYAQFLVNVWS